MAVAAARPARGVTTKMTKHPKFLAFGLLLALGTGKLVSSMLYEVSALDPIAFTVAPLVLALAGLLAGLGDVDDVERLGKLIERVHQTGYPGRGSKAHGQIEDLFADLDHALEHRPAPGENDPSVQGLIES